MPYTGAMKEQRQNEILKLVMQDGSVQTDALVRRLGVSVQTVRRDLAELEATGLLRRVYRGAVLAADGGRVTEFAQWQSRLEAQRAEKERIAEHVAALVPDGAVLAADTGTTIYAAALRLAALRSRLTVISNDMRVAQAFSENLTNTVFLVGGLLTESEQYTSGAFAEQFLDHFTQVDYFLLAADGVSAESGITSANAAINAMKQRLMAKAARTVALADHSKFGRQTLFHTCGVDAPHLLVTDTGVPAPVLRALRGAGARVETV